MLSILPDDERAMVEDMMRRHAGLTALTRALQKLYGRVTAARSGASSIFEATDLGSSSFTPGSWICIRCVVRSLFAYVPPAAKVRSFCNELKQFHGLFESVGILQQARNEGVFGALILAFMGAGMPKAYSRDLRERGYHSWLETGASRIAGAQECCSRSGRMSAVKLAAKALASAEERRLEVGAADVSPLEEFAVGDFGSDRPTAGPDLGRNGCRTGAQATDQNQPQLVPGVFSTDTTSRSKKCFTGKQPNGSEQMLARARRRWIRARYA